MKDTIYEPEISLTFELNGDYYVLAGEDEPEEAPIGTWGQRHLSYLKKHRTGAYREMLWNGTLNSYLADIDLRATEMHERIVTQLAKADGITEELKAQNQMLWVGKMNNLSHIATEIVLSDLIYC